MIDLFALYASISPDDRAMFKAKLVNESFKKGDYVLLDGEVQLNLIMVKKGTVMMFSDNDGAREIVDFAYLNRLCVDIDSFAHQTESMFSIICIENTEIEMISFKDLNELFDASHDIERAYRKILETVLSATIKRLLNQHVLTIQERFDQLIKSRPELFSRVPHKYLASYINVDPTNFSKLYNKCAQDSHRFW